MHYNVYNKNYRLIICLLGPTAVGKTQIAIELSKILPCTLISVDSAMVYRDMDIGTAKPSAEILTQAPHRLINIRDPAQSYSVGEFIQEVKIEIENSIKAGRIPLLVGGTMMYFYALQHGLADLPTSTMRLQRPHSNLNKSYETLVQCDPKTAQRIHPHDTQRIQRALEVYTLTGKPLSQLQRATLPAFSSYKIVNLAILPTDRIKLREVIRLRFEQMLKEGFIEEVAQLKQRTNLSPELPSMRMIGYRQIWRYLSGHIDKTTMQTQSVIATCQLAKRQLTWLRRWKNLYPFYHQAPKLLETMMQCIKRHL